MPASLSMRAFATAPLVAEVVLATQLFGGGVETRTVSIDQWLRPSSVKGALRFWWRALHAHRFDSVSALRARERVLFGAAANAHGIGPAPFAVAVTASGGERLAWVPGAGSALNAAYFPAQEQREVPAAKLLLPGATASIRLVPSSSMAPADWDEIRISLVAFIMLGGAGSRSRRAAGALVFASSDAARLLSAPFDLASLRTWCEELPRGDCALPVLSLGAREGVWISEATDTTGAAAQERLLRMWRDVRQDRDHPPSWTGAGGWGRSNWPEADGIRILTRQHATWAAVNHAPEVNHAPVETKGNQAPRAHLGLPIVIKFKDDDVTRRRPDRGRLTQSDPSKVTLEELSTANVKAKRYASPVILSVVRVGRKEFVGVVLVTPSLLAPTATVAAGGGTLVVGPWAVVLTRIKAQLGAHKFTPIP